MTFDDPSQHQHRAMKLRQTEDGPRLVGIVIAGDATAEAWLKPLLQDDQSVASYGSALLVPGAVPPVAVVSKGKQICTCFNVSETDIVEHLSACEGSEDARLSSLQGALKCGTNCGSCVPALRKIIRITPAVATAAAA